MQGIVSKQIQEQLSPIIQELSKECFIRPFLFYKEISYENMDTITMENYCDDDLGIHGSVKIYLNKDEMGENDIYEEYRVFKDIIPEDMPYIDVICLYYVDTKTLEEINVFFEEHENKNHGIDEIVPEDNDLVFHYKEGNISMSYEEYCERRQEIY